jgi:hypothetical protein
MIRFVQGIVVGALLMLGSAYLHDIGVLPSADKAPPPLVNWDTLTGLLGR